MKISYKGRGINDICTLQINPRVTDLDLSNNHIIEIKCLEPLILLQRLSLSGNRRYGERRGMGPRDDEWLGVVLREHDNPELHIHEIKGLDTLFYLEYLNLHDAKIKRIQGFDNNTRLKTLILSSNKVEDILGLAHLVDLEELNLRRNNITDIRALTSLTKLKKLHLGENHITDISPLSNLTQLQMLDLYQNRISSMIGLENLTHLEELYLGNNGITEIQGLDNCTRLRRLSLNGNQIKRIQGLDYLIQLEELYLGENQINEIKGLTNLTQLKRLDLHNNGEGIFSDNKIKEIKGLESLFNLEFLDLRENWITELKGLDSLVNLKGLHLGNNKITELKGLENLRELTYLDLSYNPLDINCLGRLLKYKKEGYLPKLNKVNLNETNIDWFDIKAGNIAWKLKQLGVDIEASEVRYTPPQNETESNLQDYLHAKLGLADEYVEALVSQFPTKENLQLLVQDPQVSANKVFHVRTKDGRKLLIKLETNPTKAKVEQAANYYLSRDPYFSDFIVGADVLTPVEFGEVYLLVQEDVSDSPEAKLRRPLKYYLGRMAMLHAKGYEALVREGIQIPQVRMRTFNELADCLEQKECEDFISWSKLKAIKGQYEESRAILTEGSSCLILKDPREDNRKGKFFIDLENLSIGEPSIDMFMTLYDTALNLSEPQREKYCDYFYRCLCQETGSEYTSIGSQLFFEKVRRHAMMIVGGSELNALLKPEQLRDPLKRKRAILCADMMGIRA